MASSTSHVLVIPYPIQGHINPMLQFSKRLASKGLIVTLVTTTSIANTVCVGTSSVQTACIFDGLHSGEKPDSIDVYLRLFKDSVSVSLAQFIEEGKKTENPFKVLVYDSVMSWALDIARQHGLLGVSFFTQNCAVGAIFYHLREGHLEEGEDGAGVVALPAMPELGTEDLPSFVRDKGSYPFLVSLVVDQFSNFRQADWLLFNTFDKLEKEIVEWMASQSWPIKTIGPTIPSMYLDKRLEDDKDYGISLFKPSAEDCIQWLDTKQKGTVVFASFGSLASLGEEPMKEIAWGLKDSNCYFLWVVRESEQSKLPSNFVEETSEKGLIVNWSPQLDVLGHPAVGCFMTHCGWNSTIEALSLGVPMVAMPQWTDQPTNAKFLADLWHAGVRVQARGKEMISREEIARCIREIMEGERGDELRRNAAKWRELAMEAVGEGGSSDKNIEEFVEEVASL
ncbi:hypothetical protein NMG60_11008277 [Bertholletia excelsa]